MNVHCWIAQRLFEFDIAQFPYLRQFLLNAIGIALNVGVLRAGDGDFRGGRRTEVQSLTDEIARIERKMRTSEIPVAIFVEDAPRGRATKSTLQASDQR